MKLWVNGKNTVKRKDYKTALLRISNELLKELELYRISIFEDKRNKAILHIFENYNEADELFTNGDEVKENDIKEIRIYISNSQDEMIRRLSKKYGKSINKVTIEIIRNQLRKRQSEILPCIIKTDIFYDLQVHLMEDEYKGSQAPWFNNPLHSLK